MICFENLQSCSNAILEPQRLNEAFIASPSRYVAILRAFVVSSIIRHCQDTGGRCSAIERQCNPRKRRGLDRYIALVGNLDFWHMMLYY